MNVLMDLLTNNRVKQSLGEIVALSLHRQAVGSLVQTSR